MLELQKVPWEGRIAMVKDSEIYINCGRLAGILAGDQFSVYKPGEAIVDPETGLNLGSEKTLFGKIEVVKVDEKYSKAIVVGGTGFDRNDIIKYEGPKPPPMAVSQQPQPQQPQQLQQQPPQQSQPPQQPQPQQQPQPPQQQPQQPQQPQRPPP